MSVRPRVVFLSTVIFVLSATLMQSRQQPAANWTREQIMNAVAPVRAGRKLTPPQWPNGARVAVSLNFDVDNETLTLSSGSVAPVDLSAGEFGATQGLPRVLELLDRHQVPASFFIPAVSAMLHPEMIPEIKKRTRHEIGVHGWIHENYQSINNAAEEERLMKQAIDYMTEAIGKRPAGFRAPSWAFSPFTPALVKKAGFLYDSSLMSMDEPYELVIDGKPSGLLELPVEWILDDYPYFTRTGALPSPELIFKVYKDEFDAAYEQRSMMILTMHPQAIGHRSRITHLDKLIAYMKSKPGVWFATTEQIANYIRGVSKL